MENQKYQEGTDLQRIVESLNPIRQISDESKEVGNIMTSITVRPIEIEKIIEPKVDDSWKKNIDKIKGMGPKTMEDLERLYKSESELIRALEQNRCPFREDIVIRLKNYYKLI